MSVFERRVCRVLGQHRSTQRRIPTGREDEERLTSDIVEHARQYGRYGYCKIVGLLRNAGWVVNDKRVEWIWRREGLKVPAKQAKGGGCGWRMVRACGCAPSVPITSGPMILSRVSRMMGENIAC